MILLLFFPDCIVFPRPKLIHQTHAALGPGPWTLNVNLIDRWLLVFYNIKLGANGASKGRVRLAMIANDEGAAIVL